MAKTIFEQTGDTYTIQGDYRLPDLTLPPEEKRPIGVWGQRRLRYLKQHHKILYSLFFRLVKEYSEREGVTEQLKAENPMEWVRRMNNIRSRVTKVVSHVLIYT